jgi:hypothetical protein
MGKIKRFLIQDAFPMPREKDRYPPSLPKIINSFFYLVFNSHSLSENVRLNLIFASSNRNETFKILILSHQWEGKNHHPPSISPMGRKESTPSFHFING